MQKAKPLSLGGHRKALNTLARLLSQGEDALVLKVLVTGAEPALNGLRSDFACRGPGSIPSTPWSLEHRYE